MKRGSMGEGPKMRESGERRIQRPCRDPGLSTDKRWEQQGLRQGATTSIDVLGGSRRLLRREQTRRQGDHWPLCR